MKDFFNNKIVKIVSWILLGVCLTVLVIGGVTKENIDSYVVLIFSLISVVSGIIAFISERIKLTEKK